MQPEEIPGSVETFTRWYPRGQFGVCLHQEGMFHLHRGFSLQMPTALEFLANQGLDILLKTLNREYQSGCWALILMPSCLSFSKTSRCYLQLPKPIWRDVQLGGSPRTPDGNIPAFRVQISFRLFPDTGLTHMSCLNICSCQRCWHSWLKVSQGFLFRKQGNVQPALGEQMQLCTEQWIEFGYIFFHPRSCLAQILRLGSKSIFWRCFRGLCQRLGEPRFPLLLITGWPQPQHLSAAQPQTGHPVLMALVHETFTYCQPTETL